MCGAAACLHVCMRTCVRVRALAVCGAAGKCSALIKVTGDLSDLLMGHSTWDTFTAMMRIYKHFELGLRDENIAAKRYSFSSYPGACPREGRQACSGAPLACVGMQHAACMGPCSMQR